MAAKKKAPAKKAPAKKAPAKAPKATKATKAEAAKVDIKHSALPAGFVAVSTQMAVTWDPTNPDHPQAIQGTWGHVREIEIKRGRGIQIQHVVNVTTDETTWSVWESAGLKGLFEEAEEGDEVYIKYEGLGKAKKGQNAPKIYTSGIAE